MKVLQSFWQKHRKLLLIFSSIIILIFLALLFALRQNEKVSEITQSVGETLVTLPQQPKTWKLILSYNTKTNSLRLGTLRPMQRFVTEDFRDAFFSPFSLSVLDKDDKILYTTKIIITQLLLDDESALSFLDIYPEELPTTIFVPFQPNGSAIVITEDKKTLLRVAVPSQGPQKESKVLGEACRPLQIVFLSENYSDFSEFHQDVLKIENAMFKTEPYASSQSIFDFKTIDNRASLGCRARMDQCIFNQKILDIGTTQYPSASKFVVLVKDSNDRRALGVSTLGGKVSILRKNTDTEAILPEIAVHEVLGHTVALLYDRYIYSGSEVQQNVERYLKTIGPKSNCTDDPTGEKFWRDMGQTTTYSGCSSPKLYASESLSCSPSENGSTETIMSKAGCYKNPSFDSVEKAWIRNHVIPLYKGCQRTPTPTPTMPPLQQQNQSTSQTVYYNCTFDTSCASKSLSLCSLTCTPSQ